MSAKKSKVQETIDEKMLEERKVFLCMQNFHQVLAFFLAFGDIHMTTANVT